MTEAVPPARAVSPAKSTNVRADHRRREALLVALLKLGFALLQRISTRVAARAGEALFFTPPRPRPSRVDLPAGADHPAVDGPWGRLAVWSWGSGPAVYLLHGWGGRSEQLGGFVGPLVRAGYRVVALDAPAHGRSAGRRSSIPEFARALASVARQCGRPRAVIAHSLGAAAAAFALREGLTVDRLVFVGAPADPVSWVHDFMRRVGLTQRVRDALRSVSEDRLHMSWDDLRVAPPSGDAPRPELLVIHDRDDREVPWADGAAVADAWPGSHFVTTAGLGHQRVLRARAVVAAAVAFVAGSGTSAGEACEHGSFDPGCVACALEAELFAPERRRAEGYGSTA